MTPNSARNIVIWGTGQEGIAAAHMILASAAQASLTFVDESHNATLPEALQKYSLATEPQQIASAVMGADLLVKSPGVSLYHPLIVRFQEKGGSVTSLLNLWIAAHPDVTVIAITGSKGKSTTSSLLAHVLNALGKKTALLGNIGVPVTECDATNYDLCVVEVSSYQAANFSGQCSIGVLTSLFPEHLDWHRSLDVYVRDKCNLIEHATIRLVESDAAKTACDHAINLGDAVTFNRREHFHIEGNLVYYGCTIIAPLENDFLSRTHNHGNVCAVLSVVQSLGLDCTAAVRAMETYRGLPHRQQTLAERDGILYVDDSISTTPQSAMAAMEAYVGRSITLIAGGQDRGLSYAALIEYVIKHDINVLCLGESGLRLYNDFTGAGYKKAALVSTMDDAVAGAKKLTPLGGVILLSPAAPSYDMYKNYIDRAAHFARAIEA